MLRNLSKDVFEGRTSTGSEPFSLFICLDTNKFVLLSFFSLMKRIYPRVSNKPLPNDAKGPLPVDVRPSTTLLLKLYLDIRTLTHKLILLSFIIVVRAQSSIKRQYLRDYIFLPQSYVFVLKLRESLTKSLMITLKKTVKSILRCRKTINSPNNSFRKK